MGYVLLIIVFALLQALLLGNIRIFDAATPLFYIYFAMLFPRGYSHWMRLVLCFLMGLSVDVFANTPGLAAASMTLMGFLQPYILELFLRKEDEQDFKPCVATLGKAKFFTYSLIITALYCLIFFSLEAFSFVYWLDWLISFAGSMVLTLIIIFTIDSIRR